MISVTENNVIVPYGSPSHFGVHWLYLFPQYTVRRGPQTLTDVYDITRVMGGFRVHIFCPQKTQDYLGSSMKQDRLNSRLLMHCQKSITDALDTVMITKRFACANEQRKGHFGKCE